ncbi:MAG: transposase [Acidobacteriota bacterium]
MSFTGFSWATSRNDAYFRSNAQALAYFITFSCYGSRLHGDARGSIDRDHSGYGTPFLPASGIRSGSERERMQQSDYRLDPVRRELVLKGIQEACRRRNWTLLAVHVRTQHVHCVVTSADEPEHVMTALKAYASRFLNGSGLEPQGLRRWSRHGSTVYLWTPAQVDNAIRYVIHEQGEPMVVFRPGCL